MAKRKALKILQNFATTTTYGLALLSNEYNGTSTLKAVTEKALNDGLSNLFNVFNTNISNNQDSITDLQNKKQNITDQSLNTDDKSIVGSINELDSKTEEVKTEVTTNKDNISSLNDSVGEIGVILGEDGSEITNIKTELSTNTTNTNNNTTNINSLSVELDNLTNDVESILSYVETFLVNDDNIKFDYVNPYIDEVEAKVINGIMYLSGRFIGTFASGNTDEIIVLSDYKSKIRQFVDGWYGGIYAYTGTVWEGESSISMYTMPNIDTTKNNRFHIDFPVEKKEVE